MRKTPAVLTAVLLAVLFGSLLGNVSAQTYTPGVASGNVFKYQFTLSSNVTGSNQNFWSTPIDKQMIEAETTDFVQITVKSVSGSTITAEALTRYKNGTTQTFIATADVSSGAGILSQFFIAANLTAGNTLYLGGDGKINGAITKTYTSGVTRELNYLSLSTQTIIPASEVAKYNLSVPLTQVNSQEAYWDKQTGALSEIINQMQTTSTQLNATLTVKLTIVESNVFTIPEYSIMPLTLLMLAASTVLVLKKRKNLHF